MKKNRGKKKRKAKLIRSFILLLLIAGVVFGVCLYTPFFNVTEIAISGNETVSAEDIKNSSGVLMNTNIFKISKKDVKESLASIPQIDNINIKRKLPKRITIEITETQPQLIFPYLSGYAVTNENGKVLELLDDISAYSYTVINGVNINNAIICKQIAVQDEVTFDIMKKCVDVLRKKDMLSMFKSLDFSNISNIFGYTQDGVKIIFGKTDDMEYKLSVLGVVLPQVGKSEGTYIDLTTPSSAFAGRSEATEPPKEEKKQEDSSDDENKKAETEKKEND